RDFLSFSGWCPKNIHRQIVHVQRVHPLTTISHLEGSVLMKKFAKLAKEGKIGRLCQRGAWIVAALGTLQIFLQLYSSWGMYQQMQLNAQGSPYSDVSFFLNSVSFVFGSVI